MRIEYTWREQITLIYFNYSWMDRKLHYSPPVTFSALSGLLFFSFFVQRSIKKKQQQWSPDEYSFVASRCKFGNRLRLLLLLFVGSFAIGSGTWSKVFYLIAEIIGYFVISLICLWMIAIVSGFSFSLTRIQQDATQKRKMLISFLPFYSEYERFSAKQFEKPYRWSKEAQVWRFMIALFTLFSPSLLVMLCPVFLLFMRVILLIGWYDILPQEQKIRLHQLFKRYPEEIPISLLILSKKDTNQEAWNLKEELEFYQDTYIAPKSTKDKVFYSLLTLSVLGLLGRWIWTSNLRWKGLFLIRRLARMLTMNLTSTLIPIFPLSYWIKKKI